MNTIDGILKERASEHLYFICLLAAPIWLAWISFDYLFAKEWFYVFLIIRILGSLFSLGIIYLLKRTKLVLWKLQTLMFLYYNIGVGFMLIVINKEILYIYFYGFAMIMMLMFFILILNYLELILFSLISGITFTLVLLLNTTDVVFILGNGGFVFLTILVIMIAIGILKYKGVMRDASIAIQIQGSKEIEKLNLSLEKSLKEKEILLQEVHHRVKNNLQIISSILNLQTSYTEDQEVQKILDGSIGRIKSMSTIHEMLYETNDFSAINFANYLEKLVERIIKTYTKDESLEINIISDNSPVNLTIHQAIPCGLIVNELITNTVKYGFVGRKKGTIFLSLKNIGGSIHLTLGDDGIGFKDDFDLEGVDPETLGLQLVKSLAQQLDASLDIDHNEGVKFIFIFQKKDKI